MIPSMCDEMLSTSHRNRTLLRNHPRQLQSVFDDFLPAAPNDFGYQSQLLRLGCRENSAGIG